MGMKEEESDMDVIHKLVVSFNNAVVLKLYMYQKTFGGFAKTLWVLLQSFGFSKFWIRPQNTENPGE